MQPLLPNFPSALELPEAAAAAAGSALPGRLKGPSMKSVVGTALFDQETPGLDLASWQRRALYA